MSVGRFSKYLDNKVFLLSAFIIFAVFIISMPIINRMIAENPVISDAESYYNLRVSDNLFSHGDFDDSSAVIKPFYKNPYHFFLFVSQKILGKNLLAFIPLLLGIFTLIISYFVFLKLGFKQFNILISMVLLLLSPIFIYVYSSLNHYSLLLFFMILCMFFFMQDRAIYQVFSLCLIGIIYFFGFFNALFSLFMLLIFSLYKKEKLIWFLVSLFTIFLLYSIYPVHGYYFFDSIANSSDFGFIFELGSKIGFSIFLILLCVIGFLITWGNKKKLYPIYLIFIFAIIMSFFNNFEALLYSAFIICVFGSYGLLYLYQKRWESDLVKKLTLLIILFAIVSSSIFFITSTSSFEPTKVSNRAMSWMSANTQADSMVFSHPSSSFFIQEISKRKTFTDNIDVLYLENPDNIKSFNDILSASEIPQLEELLIQEGISIIYVNDALKEYSDNKGIQRGLLILLRNNETFKKVYKERDIEIYEVI